MLRESKRWSSKRNGSHRITKAAVLRGVGYQSMIFLTLIFICGDGCGSPASVTLPTPYETQQQCMEAGKVWISTAANFTFAIKGYQCDESP